MRRAKSRAQITAPPPLGCRYGCRNRQTSGSLAGTSAGPALGGKWLGATLAYGLPMTGTKRALGIVAIVVALMGGSAIRSEAAGPTFNVSVVATNEDCPKADSSYHENWAGTAIVGSRVGVVTGSFLWSCWYDFSRYPAGGTLKITALDASLTVADSGWSGCHCRTFTVTEATGAWSGVSGSTNVFSFDQAIFGPALFGVPAVGTISHAFTFN